MAGKVADAAPAPVTPPKKLSYKEQRELEQLPHRIEVLESENAELQTRIGSPEFYKEGTEGIAKSLARAAAVEAELLAAYARWDELESRRAV